MADQAIKMDGSSCRNPGRGTRSATENLGREPTDQEVTDVVEMVAALDDDVEFAPHQNDFIRMMLDSAMSGFPHSIGRQFLRHAF